jgi:hypothetical protein
VESSFRNRENAKQLIDFGGLKYGLCSPSDVDLTIEWKGKTFVFVEVKRKGTPLTIGQRIYLENVVKAINAGGKHAVSLFVEHDGVPVEQDVMAKDTKVLAAYGSDEEWVDIKPQNCNLKDYLQKIYLHHLDRNNLTH